jgi:hypothetical protein
MFPAPMTWCASTPASGTVLSAHVGEEVTVDLCVQKDAGVAAPLDIRAVTVDVPGSMPYNLTNPTTVFAPPYDSINFPALGTLDPPNVFPFQDPFTRKYRFTPKVGSMQGGSGGGGLRCTPIHPPHHCNLKTSG